MKRTDKKSIRAYRIKKLKVFVWNILVNMILGSYLVPSKIRGIVLRILGVEFTSDKGRIRAEIKQKCFIASNKLSFGKGVFINRFTCLDNLEGHITFMENSGTSYNVTILTSTHETGNSSCRCGEFISQDVVIGKGVWVCANVTILPGVTIGDGCIIAAGAVVTKDCEPDCLYAGVPAVLKKKL